MKPYIGIVLEAVGMLVFQQRVRMAWGPWLVLISCLTSCSDDLAKVRAPNKNVLLITIDTLRAAR